MAGLTVTPVPVTMCAKSSIQRLCGWTLWLEFATDAGVRWDRCGHRASFLLSSLSDFGRMVLGLRGDGPGGLHPEVSLMFRAALLVGGLHSVWHHGYSSHCSGWRSYSVFCFVCSGFDSGSCR